jgi:RNA polymerase sigma factor (sigma-70 family)
MESGYGLEVSAQTDEGLLEAWRAGDQRAGNELFERHFDLLYAFFRNKTTDSIDDLVQRTFLACVEGRDRFRGDAPFRGYMLGVARRLLFRAYHERRVDGERIDFGVSSLHDLSPSPSQIVVHRIEQRVVLESLRRVALDQQVALELYYFQGYRGPELAQILDVPEPTVRSRLHRGLEQLRRLVGELGESPKLLDVGIDQLEAWLSELGEVIAQRDEAAVEG